MSKIGGKVSEQEGVVSARRASSSSGKSKSKPLGESCYIAAETMPVKNALVAVTGRK